MTIRPRIDPGSSATASERPHSGCTGDEAPRPARSRREREADSTRPRPSGCLKEAGGVALAGWITPQERWALRASLLSVSLRASNSDSRAVSNRRYIAGRPTHAHPPFSAHGQVRNIHTARSATLDHRHRLFVLQTPLKMGGACPLRPCEVPVGEIPQPDPHAARRGTCRRHCGGILHGQPGRRGGRQLDAGRPVVAEVRLGANQHFVLLTGYTTEGGILMNDPWFADSVRFIDRYGDPAAGIVSIRTFMPADPDGARGHGRLSWLANAVAAVHLSR